MHMREPRTKAGRQARALWQYHQELVHGLTFDDDNLQRAILAIEDEALSQPREAESAGLDVALQEVGRVAIGIVNDWIGDPDHGYILDPLVVPVEKWRALLATQTPQGDTEP